MKSKTRNQKLWLYLAVGVFALAVAAILWNFRAVSSVTKWLAFSRRYKAEVLAQPVSRNGELQHIEWGGWGIAGIDTTVYLVFDATDSLSVAAKTHGSGKFNGIPCEVFRVIRLEKYWYTVQFYTEESWGSTNSLNCSGGGTQASLVVGISPSHYYQIGIVYDRSPYHSLFVPDTWLSGNTVW